MVKLDEVHTGHGVGKLLVVIHFIGKLFDLLFKAKIVLSCIFFWQMVSIQDTVHLPLDIIGRFILAFHSFT